MLSYTIHCSNPNQYCLKVELRFAPTGNESLIQVPFWRPGRYEPGNFPRLIRNFRAYQNSQTVHSEKISSHQWKIHSSQDAGDCTVTYDLFAADLTAGNTYFDREMLLINPVNCLVYPLGKENEYCEIDLRLLEKWPVATSFGKTIASPGAYSAANIQELLDTPILAAPDLQTLAYQYGEVTFYIHSCGSLFPDKEKLLSDFSRFTKSQVDAFGSFPVAEYHFLFIFTPHRFHHGVEHDKSTVIVLGPGQALNTEPLYNELLGVSSHELYHTWNVKSLRPKDWFPYDFTRECPSRLGYVAEGITTYMGDRMLWDAGIMNDDAWLTALGIHIQRHLENEGRHHLSLGDASVDTWVDGYNRNGTPERRISIYTEGALLSLICDVWIMKASAGELNLISFMRRFYNRYHEEGYTEDDFWGALSEFANMPWQKLRDDVIDGTGMLEGYLTDALDFLGLEIDVEQVSNKLEATLGVRLICEQDRCIVGYLVPSSPAEKAGLWYGSQIIAIEGISPIDYLKESAPELPSNGMVEFKTGFRTKRTYVETSERRWVENYKVLHKKGVVHPTFKDWKIGVRVTSNLNLPNS